MKLVTYRRSRNGVDEIGVLVDDTVVDLLGTIELQGGGERPDAHHLRMALTGPCGDPMGRLLSSWEVAKRDIDRLLSGVGVSSKLPLSSVVVQSPVPRPTSMRDGYAFRQHVEAARRNRGVPMIPEFDDFPVFYFTNHMAVTGPGDVLVRDEHLDRLDFELECAIVIGREGRDIAVVDADEFVAGFMVMNDWSARRLQMDEMKLNLGPAKGKDFATSLGPYLVTPDELEDRCLRGTDGIRYDLAMVTRVNGVEVSRGNVRDMSWTFAQIIARASYGVTLYPGDVIGSGTVGTGCFLELNGSKITDNWWLKEGDVVECEIDRLGCLRNTVVQYTPVT